VCPERLSSSIRPHGLLTYVNDLRRGRRWDGTEELPVNPLATPPGLSLPLNTR
jgi:hypothetical protein